jgi:hypothetical protein
MNELRRVGRGADHALSLHQLIIGLQTDEETVRHFEIARQPQVGVGGDGALAQDDLVDAPRRYADRACERRL